MEQLGLEHTIAEQAASSDPSCVEAQTKQATAWVWLQQTKHAIAMMDVKTVVPTGFTQALAEGPQSLERWMTFQDDEVVAVAQSRCIGCGSTCEHVQGSSLEAGPSV